MIDAVAASIIILKISNLNVASVQDFVHARDRAFPWHDLYQLGVTAGVLQEKARGHHRAFAAFQSGLRSRLPLAHVG